MAQTQEVVHERQAGVTPMGKQITREKTQVVSPEAEKYVAIWSLSRLVFYLFGLIETLLVFRFVLKILGANSRSSFVGFIYQLSSVFEAPFRGIFRTAVAEGLETAAVLEPSTIVAILVYLVVAVAVVSLIRIVTATREED